MPVTDEGGMKNSRSRVFCGSRCFLCYGIRKEKAREGTGGQRFDERIIPSTLLERTLCVTHTTRNMTPEKGTSRTKRSQYPVDGLHMVRLFLFLRFCGEK
ncbi:hypothetical protein [Escherichia coli]|uniref:hypothetical protein n=1 Tax=Escherichia coli TaxID=562 RepID=UPI001F0E828B|nr:hypothetical protein [Escherichia coli]